MGGGGDNRQYNLNLRKAFSDTPDSTFESYVDSRGDLANAWRQIQENPESADSQYWIKKAEGGRFNKADFGRFHAAEDQALLAGNYPGGTEVRKGTDAYSRYFPEGATSFDQFSSGGGLLDEGGGTGETTAQDNNPYFPILMQEYAPPSAQDWSAYMPRVGPYNAPTPYLGGGAPANFPQATLYPGIGEDVDPGIPNYNIGGLLYQPWTTEYQQAFVPPNIWNYTPPQLNVGSPTFSGTPATGFLEVVHPEPEPETKNNGDPGSEEGRDSRYAGDSTGGVVDPRGFFAPVQDMIDDIYNNYDADNDFGDATDYGDPGWGGELPV